MKIEKTNKSEKSEVKKALDEPIVISSTIKAAETKAKEKKSNMKETNPWKMRTYLKIPF